MIVVEVDQRPGARDAVALGRSLARTLDEDLLLVWVRPTERRPGRLSASFRMPALLERRLEGEGTEGHLRGLAAETEAALPGALRCRLRTVVADDPAEGLAQVAAEEQASLLVLGASQRSSLGTPLVVVPRSPEFGRSRRTGQPAPAVAGAQPAPA